MNGTHAPPRSKMRMSETRKNGARGCGFGCCASVLPGVHGWCPRRSDKPGQTVKNTTHQSEVETPNHSWASQNRNRTRWQTDRSNRRHEPTYLDPPQPLWAGGGRRAQTEVTSLSCWNKTDWTQTGRGSPWSPQPTQPHFRWVLSASKPNKKSKTFLSNIFIFWY